MATINKFEDILSWKEARQLNILIGKMIDEKRFKTNYRLIDQIEGSAGSIMDNIAEGFERAGKKEFIQFIYIYQKLLVENYVLNYTGRWIELTFNRKSLKFCLY